MDSKQAQLETETPWCVVRDPSHFHSLTTVVTNDGVEKRIADFCYERDAIEAVRRVNKYKNVVYALRLFYDGVCHCHEHGVSRPCVQCVAGEALRHEPA